MLRWDILCLYHNDLKAFSILIQPNPIVNSKCLSPPLIGLPVFKEKTAVAINNAMCMYDILLIIEIKT